MVSAKRKGGGKHPSHDTRFSMSSLYDEVCVNCGATDLTGGGWGKLAEPCPKAKKKEEKMSEKPTPHRGEVYTYKGQQYLVREVSQKNMIQFKDSWHPNVIYTLYPVTDLVFNRALPDFLAKFEKSEIDFSKPAIIGPEELMPMLDKDGSGSSDADLCALSLEGYARDANRGSLPATASTLRLGAMLIRSMSAYIMGDKQ